MEIGREGEGREKERKKGYLKIDNRRIWIEGKEWR